MKSLEWCLPGAFWHYDIWQTYIEQFTPSVFYDGVNCCLWNGGRGNVKSNKWNDDIAESYGKYGHAIALTFSNQYCDIDDETGNYLLQKLYNFKGSAIIRNENLIRYINKKYPDIKLIYSITGTPDKYDVNFYKNILKLCAYVVPRWHHINDIAKDFTNDLDRFEIMINHTCPSQCPYWNAHYHIIDKANRSCDTNNEYDSDIINCMINEQITDSKIAEIDIMKRFITAYRLGFTRYKLAGREFPKERLKSQIDKLYHIMIRI